MTISENTCCADLLRSTKIYWRVCAIRWTPENAKDGRAAANVLLNYDLVPSSVKRPNDSDSNDDEDDNSIEANGGSDKQKQASDGDLRIPRPGSAGARGPGGLAPVVGLQDIATSPISLRKAVGASPLGKQPAPLSPTGLYLYALRLTSLFLLSDRLR